LDEINRVGDVALLEHGGSLAIVRNVFSVRTAGEKGFGIESLSVVRNRHE
jgi:hypothetical protein